MLTVQSGISNHYNSSVGFGKKNRGQVKSEAQIIAELRQQEIEKEEQEYKETRSRIEGVKEDVLELVDMAPKPIQSTGKVLAIGASSLLGGMAVGWGGRKSINGIKELFKTDAGLKFVKNFKGFFKSVKDGFVGVKDAIKAGRQKAKDTFKETSFYAKSKDKYDNFFENNKFGIKLSSIKKSIVENSIYQKVTGRISNAYKGTKEGIGNMYNKICGIKSEQVEKTAVNTLGISGGVASGVTAIKEQAKEDKVEDL